MSERELVGFNVLHGLTITGFSINDNREKIAIETSCGRRFEMRHDQECCESVGVEDVCGDIADIIGSPILLAEESCQDGGRLDDFDSCSSTWTFYKLATIKGAITIRWLGVSNGYYSETVDMYEVTGETKH